MQNRVFIPIYEKGGQHDEENRLYGMDRMPHGAGAVPGTGRGGRPRGGARGGFTFTKRQLQSAIDADIGLSEALGQVYLTDEEKQAQREDTINRFIGVGLIECKLQDAGKNDFTPDEEERLKAAARNQYEQLWQGLWQRAQDSGEDFTEAQVTEFMQDEGYTPRPSMRNTRPPSGAIGQSTCSAPASR